MKMPPPLDGMPPLGLLAALAALAAALPDPPPCGHEVRADREAERAAFLEHCLRSVRSALGSRLESLRDPRTANRSEHAFLPGLVEAIDADLKRADGLTRHPQYDAELQAKAAGEASRPVPDPSAGYAQAAEAQAEQARPDPAELSPDLRRGILTTVHALGELPLPPGATAELTIRRRKD